MYITILAKSLEKKDIETYSFNKNNLGMVIIIFVKYSKDENKCANVFSKIKNILGPWSILFVDD